MDIRLSNSLIPQGTAIGATVGTFLCIDQDAKENFTFSMLDSDGPFTVDAIQGKLMVCKRTFSYKFYLGVVTKL